MPKNIFFVLCMFSMGCSEPMLRSAVDGPGPGIGVQYAASSDLASSAFGGIPEADTRRISDSVVRLQSESPQNDNATQNVTPSKRLIVYSAMFKVETANVDEAVIRFKKIVEDVGGYLEQRKNAQLVSRIPAARFDEVVDVLPELGTIRSQSIENEDVTDQYRDLGLRIETAQWSRKRILALLERAEEIEDVLKLEEELRNLTEQIEGLMGKSAQLKDKIAYSTVEVAFVDGATGYKVPSAGGSSLFPWINAVGADQVAIAFQNTVDSGKLSESSASAFLTGVINVDLPDRFLIIDQQREELKATTADNAKLWIRELVISKHAELEFWSKALQNHLVENRGYTLLSQQNIQDKRGREGVEFTFETQVSNKRYSVMVFADQMKLLSRKRKIRVIEFVSSRDAFDSYMDDVRIATTKSFATAAVK